MTAKKTKTKNKQTAIKPIRSTAKAKTSAGVKKVPARTAKKSVARAAATAVPAVPAITNDHIASRAYLIWEQSGRPSGRELEFWLQAEQQLKQDLQAFAA